MEVDSNQAILDLGGANSKPDKPDLQSHLGPRPYAIEVSWNHSEAHKFSKPSYPK